MNTFKTVLPIVSTLGIAASLCAHTVEEAMADQYAPTESNISVQPLPREMRYFIGNANTTTDVTKLQSRPGMPFVIYLWFDPSRNASEELQRTIWEQIADDWIMFRCNVTTDRAVWEAMPLNRRAKCNFKEYFANGGGSKDETTGERVITTNLKMNHVPETGGDFLYRTPSHELGHTFDLVHDICTSPWSNYYSGHGEWVPIMGSSNSRAVAHWSKGEYKGAGNGQDDIAVIGAELGFVDDDKPEAVALVIENDGTVEPLKNNGIITTVEDTDEFTFVVEDKATVNITCDPSLLSPNLDAGLYLKDSEGTVIASDEPVGKRTATITTTIDEPGTYTLVVDGVGELDPSSGWSDYASRGYYHLTGSIDGGTTSIQSKVSSMINAMVINHNKATGMLTITGVNDFNAIQLVSVTGAVIKSYEKANRINVSSVTPGNYILVFKNGENVVASKVLTIQ